MCLAFAPIAGAGGSSDGGASTADGSAQRDLGGAADQRTPPADLATGDRAPDLAIRDLASPRADLATPDLALPDLATRDLPSNRSVELMLTIDLLFQNCMPIVAPDPVHLQTTLAVDNQGMSPIGPIQVTKAELIDGGGNTLATFTADLKPFSLGAGMRTSIMVAKQRPSLIPANGCATIPCNTRVAVQFTLEGPGLPAGTTVTSAAQAMMCAF